MVFYSVNSRKNVFHLPHCSHVKKIKPEHRRTFESPEEARKEHYILCRCCSPVGQRFRKERTRVEQFCQEHGVIVYLHDGQLVVTTPRSKWKIVAGGKANKLMLYLTLTIHSHSKIRAGLEVLRFQPRPCFPHILYPMWIMHCYLSHLVFLEPKNPGSLRPTL